MSALKAYLASLNGEVPDLAKLRELGVPQKKAIEICTAAAHRPAVSPPTLAITKPMEIAPEARAAGSSKTNSLPFAEPEPTNLPLAKPPASRGIVGMDIPAIAAPRPQPAPAAPVEPEPEWVAMSKLHELSIHCESGYSSPDDLVNVGFSKACAEEVSRAINAARCGHVLPEHRIEATAAAVSERISRVIANRKEIRK